MSDLPRGWAITSLCEVATLITDGDHNPPKRVPEGVPHLTARNVKGGHLLLDRCTFISPEDFARMSRRYAPLPGDVIVTCVGTLGQTAIVPESLAFSADRNLAAIRPNGAILSSFLKAALDAPEPQAIMKGGSGSTAQPHLYLSDLRRLKIRVPPLAEQGRIIAAIEEQFSLLDAGVRAIERVRHNIKRIRAAIFEAAATEWVGEKFPLTRLADVLREPLRNGYSAKVDPLGSIPILSLTAVTLDDFGAHNLKMTAADPRRVRDLWIQPGDLLIERSNTRELVGTACLYRGHPGLAVYPDLARLRLRPSRFVVPQA